MEIDSQEFIPYHYTILVFITAQEQSKPFSWAHMASKNTIGNAPQQVNVKPTPVAPVIQKAAPAQKPAMDKPAAPEQVLKAFWF